MRRFFAVLAAAVALIWCGPPASAWLAQVPAAPNNYYFATAGSDSNNCLTTGTACQTITHLNSLTFASNPQIHLNGGDTFSGSIALTTTNVPSGNATVTSYGAGNPTISSGNSAECLTATNLPGVTVSNLICTGGGNTTNTTQGIYVKNTQAGNTLLAGPTITGNTVSGYGLNGILVTGENGTSGFSNTTITANTVHDVTGNETNVGATSRGTSCIELWSPAGYGTNNVHRGAAVNGNTVYNCTGTVNAAKWSGSGIFVSETSNAVIGTSAAPNIAHDFSINNNGDASEAVGIWCADSDGCIIQYNECYNPNVTTGNQLPDCYDIDGGAINTVLQFNWAHDNNGRGILLFAYNDGTVTTWANNTARFNIAQNNKGGDIVVGPSSAMTGIAIYNNTVGAFAGENAFLCYKTSTMSGNVANNIFFGRADVNLVSCPIPSSIAFNGNDYYGSAKFSWNGSSYTTFASWKTGSGQETVNGGSNSNPQIYVPGGGFITNGYQPTQMMAYNLQAGSPMLPNAGINLNSQFGLSVGTQDFFGNAVTASTLPVGAAAADAGTFAASCTAATNFLARVSSFSKANNINYNSLLCGLNSDGDLAHTDFLYILGAPNSAASLLNLISTSYSLTLHGSTTFAANVGITGDGSTGYYDTGFVPSSAGGHMTINSTAVQVYDLSSRATTQTYSAIGAVDATTDTEVDPMRFTGSAFVSANDFTGFQPTQTTSAGLTLVNRTGATATAAYQNGSSIGTAGTTSIGLPTVSFFVLAKNSSGSAARFSADQLSAVMGGDGTISPSRTSLRLNSFMTSLGINVY